jgi:hypothetical protein
MAEKHNGGSVVFFAEMGDAGSLSGMTVNQIYTIIET